MGRIAKFYLIVFCMFLLLGKVLAQEKYTISGHITDGKNGEELISATVYVDEIKSGTITNVYGYYSLTLPQGKYTIKYNYLGFEETIKEINLTDNKTVNIELNEKSEEIVEVIVSGERKDQNIEQVEMSVEKVQMKTIKKLPAFFGEVDVIKSLQLLPGVQSGGEGSSGLYVRGGGPDQNLLILDEAPVYNASHLLGFFSVFNSDAIKDLKIYKGGMPAQYGGKASSVIDIRMKDGNQKHFAGKGAISNLASRLTLEGPIIKDKWSFIASGRRTYADLVGRLAGIDELKDNKLYFYDVNFKTNFKLNDNNRFYASMYTGDDMLELGESLYMHWGNWTTTFRWNHIFGQRLFMNFTGLYAKYKYNLGVPGNNAESFDWKSKIRDVNVKFDFTYFLNTNNKIRFGYNPIYHYFEPGTMRGSDSSFFNVYKVQPVNALENAIYVSNEQKIGKLSLMYGVRAVMFQHIGEGTQYLYEDENNPTDETILDIRTFKKNEVIESFPGIEPRLSAKYTLNKRSSVKFAYNRNIQNLHLISNTNSPTPFDIWLPSNKYIKPLIANQVALGYFRNFKNNAFETSAEVYYKKMDNQIDYKPGAELFLNHNIETELLHGNAYSYGMEFMLKKQEGRLTGWMSYTYARVSNKIPGVNEGKKYPSSYERVHDFTLIGTYTLNEHWTFSANWVFISGNPVSYPETKYMIQGNTVNHYSERNAYRIPDYHRLDLSATYDINPLKNSRWKHSLNFSLYNVYARRNAYSVTFRANEDNPKKLEANRLSIIGSIIPAISYNFNF